MQVEMFTATTDQLTTIRALLADIHTDHPERVTDSMTVMASLSETHASRAIERLGALVGCCAPELCATHNPI